MFSHIDLFSGIGGFRIASELCGGRSIFFSEIDKTAISYYCQNFKSDTSENLGDITKIKFLPSHDFLTAGVPCQSWSIAGKNLGFNDPRGLLWEDTIRLLKESKPKSFIFENVKGLSDLRNINSLEYIKNKLKTNGYYFYVLLLDSNKFGSIQSRVRTYIVGFKEERFFKRFSLDNLTLFEPKTLGESLWNISSNEQGIEMLFLNDLRGGQNTIHSWDLFSCTERQKQICSILLKNRRKSKYGNLDGNPLSHKHFRELDQSITLAELEELINLDVLKVKRISPDGSRLFDFKHGKISRGINNVSRVIFPCSKSYPTLVASDTLDYISEKNFSDINSFLNEYRVDSSIIRKITKEEACKIQGFSTNFILPPKRSKWMKLLGNSVSIPTVKILTEQIVKTGVFV
jgi:DNA (cytosine-5)-methyltransferase 1